MAETRMEPSAGIVRQHRAPAPPPILASGVAGWSRENLFSSWANTVITLVLAWVILEFTLFIVNWGFVDAVWFGDSAKACANPNGACWAFVTDRWRLFIYGLFPAEERWRVNIVYLLAGATLAVYLYSFGRYTKMLRIALVVVFPLAAFILLIGGVLGLEHVPADNLGGLLLTLVISSTGILGSIPLGLILALGRQSELPIIRRLCTGFIEFWRGVPLIVVIVAFVALLPIFIPDGSKIDVVVRAFIAFAVFNSAYMAEVFRGGLQSIPKGQYEAAKSIGLPYWKMMGHIILPQAIRNSVPALVNTCISIFKETTLILLVGFSDLLGIIQLSLEDPKWLGPPHIFASAYIFAAIIYFIFTFGMSRYSIRLENRSNVEH